MSPLLYTKSSTDILERKSRRIHPSTRSFVRPHRRFLLSRVPRLSPGRRQRVPHAARARVRRLIRQRSKHLHHRRGNDARATQFQHRIVYLSTHVHPHRSRQFVQRVRRCDIDRSNPFASVRETSGRLHRRARSMHPPAFRVARPPRASSTPLAATIDAVGRVDSRAPERRPLPRAFIVVVGHRVRLRPPPRRIASHRVASRRTFLIRQRARLVRVRVRRHRSFERVVVCARARAASSRAGASSKP